MAHLAFTILLVAVALSGALAIPSLSGLIPIPIPIPDILPNIIPDPVSVDDACSKIDHGVSKGKSGINLRISADLIANLRDPTLTPVCKECIANKSKKIREDTIAAIDSKGEELKTELRKATDLLSLLSIWSSEIDLLPTLIVDIIVNCNKDLDTARSDCIASTSAPAA